MSRSDHGDAAIGGVPLLTDIEGAERPVVFADRGRFSPSSILSAVR
jgi:hypothetical protein